ncbi:MAG: hypothetical protein AB1918_06490 [Pseudomonadota bacterium]
MTTDLGPHTAMDHASDDTWTDAGFRLSWPGNDAGALPERRGGMGGGALTSLLRRALPARDCCTGWPITLSAPSRR